jgi:hypothetical protein
MSTETYDRARTEVLRAAPMNGTRFNALPNWLKAHLTNLIARLDDAYKDLERLSQELAATEAREGAKVGTTGEPFDHTMGDQERPGRYVGDQMAELGYDPLYAGRKKWLVVTGTWREDRYTAKGHAEGYKDRDYWAESASIFDEYESKRFSTAEKAIAYVCKGRAAADAHWIRLRLRDIAEGQRTQVA